jgi:hypothetical protein
MDDSEQQLFRQFPPCQTLRIPDKIGREVTFFVTFQGPHEKSHGEPWLFVSGGSGEIRTRDQRIKSPLLYQLSYRPVDKVEPDPRKREIIAEAPGPGKVPAQLFDVALVDPG